MKTTRIYFKLFVFVEQFLTGKDEHEKDDDNKTVRDRLKDSNKGVVKCRYQFHFNSYNCKIVIPQLAI